MAPMTDSVVCLKGTLTNLNSFTAGKKTAKKGWKRIITKPTFVGYV